MGFLNLCILFLFPFSVSDENFVAPSIWFLSFPLSSEQKPPGRVKQGGETKKGVKLEEDITEPRPTGLTAQLF